MQAGINMRQIQTVVAPWNGTGRKIGFRSVFDVKLNLYLAPVDRSAAVGLIGHLAIINFFKLSRHLTNGRTLVDP